MADFPLALVPSIRYALYGAVFYLGSFKSAQFIYFQF